MVAVVRRQLGIKQVGHAGTLDPFATGLLVVLVGRSTRLARFVMERHKEYHAVVRFGRSTDTDDATGNTVQEKLPAHWPSAGELDDVLGRFIGTIMQRPPAFSAKHVAGRRSHRLARAGKPVELAAVPVVIDSLDRLGWEPPDLMLRMTVGKGTYVRALARDIGAAMGIPAHCRELRRTAAGGFDLASAVRPDQVSARQIIPANLLVAALPRVVLDDEAVGRVAVGRRVPRIEAVQGEAALVATDGRLLAIAEPRGREWQPVIVMEPAG